MSNLALCLSLRAQQANPVRYWSRDTLVCPSSLAVAEEQQKIYKASVLANTNGNGNGDGTGQLSKAMRYSKLAQNFRIQLCN